MEFELRSFIAATILKISLSQRYHMKASDQINKMFHLDFFISTHRAVEMRPKSKHFLGQDINATDVTPVPNENL